MTYGVIVINLTKGTEKKKFFDTFEEAEKFVEFFKQYVDFFSTDKFEIYYLP